MAYALSEDVVIPLGTALAEGRLEPFPYREDVSVGLLMWVFARWGCCWCLLAATSDALALSLNCQMGDLEDDLRLAFTVGPTPFWDGVATLFGHSIDYDMNDVDQIHLNCFSNSTPATRIIQQCVFIQSVLPCRLFSSTTAKSSSSEG